MKNLKLKKQPNPFIVFIGLVTQMGVTIFCAAYLGKFIDAKFNYDKTYTISLTLLGVAISFYILINQLKKMN
ncbi:MAG: AtpZ/AtpI family protein [Bacteroidota bacterium]